MQNKALISIILSLTIIGGIFFLVSGKQVSPETDQGAKSQNVEIRDGIQYVTITAKGGYSPRVTNIQGAIPTKLIVKTNNTRDCSLSLYVRSVGFGKVLQSTGEEVIDLGIPKPGEQIDGTCAMGMYSFKIIAGEPERQEVPASTPS